MKRLLALVSLILLCALSSKAQTQTTTITIVAAASLGTITPTPAHFYSNIAAPISLASSTSGFNSTCSGTSSLPGTTTTTPITLTYSTTTLALTGTLSAAQTNAPAGSTLTITITCTPSPLTFNAPVVLPNGTVGNEYSANLLTVTGLAGGVPPYTWKLNSGTLPGGLTLSSSGVVSGVPSAAGSDTFSILVQDSSGQTFNFTSPVLLFRDRATGAGLRS